MSTSAPLSLVDPWKWLLRVLFCTAVILSTTSCGLQIGEQPANNQRVDLGERLGCLSSFGSESLKFLNAKLSNAKVSELADCLRFSITAFEKYVDGRDKESYRPEEIQRFLQKYFLSDAKGSSHLVLTDSHLEELAHLKALVIGGTPDIVTKNELRTFVQRLDKIEQALLILNSVMPVINWPLRTIEHEPKETIRKRQESTERARQALFLAASLVAESIPTTSGQAGFQYDLSRVGSLIAEFRDFIGWKPPPDTDRASLGRSASVWGEFVKQFFLLSRGGSSQISRDDFRALLKSIAKWYGWMTLMKVEVQDAEGSYFYGAKFLGLSRTMELFFDLFGEILNHRQRVGFHTFRRFVKSLGDMGFIPFGIKPVSVSRVFEEFVRKVLGDLSLPPAKRSASAFNLSHLESIRQEYQGWKRVQTFIADRWASTTIDAEILDLKNQGSVAFAEMAGLINELRPVLPNDSHTVYLLEKEKMAKFKVRHDASNLTMLNLYRVLYRLAIKGFANYDPTRDMKFHGLTAGQFQEVYDALRPIGLDTGLMDPRGVGSGARSYMEANLFTYHGDGYGRSALKKTHVERLVTFHEGVQFLQYLQSVAFGANSLYNNLRKSVGESGRVDPAQCLPYLDRQRVKEKIVDLLIDESGTMPGLQMYLRDLDREERLQYAEIMLKAAYSKATSEAADAVDLVEKNEVTIAFAVVQYAETILTKFNTLGDEVLSREEVENAYPRFKEFVRGMLVSMGYEDPSESFVLGVFRYIISNGDIPNAEAGKLEKAWIGLGFFRRSIIWRIKLDRMDILKIFSSVIAKSSEMAQQGAPKLIQSEFPDCSAKD